MPSRQHLKRPLPVVDSLSSTRVHPVRASLRAEEVCVGCIVWLPDMMETSSVRQFRMSDETLKTEGYYHPVVILGITPHPAPAHTSDLKICFAILTTFRGVTLAQYETTKELLRPSIAIVDNANPWNSQYLHLENERKLRKQSYVRLENVYETSISNLRSYFHELDFPAYHLRLDKESYHKLMSLLSLDAQDYPATNTLESARKTSNNCQLPIHAPASATTQHARNPDVAPHPPAPIVTQDLRNPRGAPDPTATRNICDLLGETNAPDQPAWTPEFRQNSAGPAMEPYGDIFVDLETRVPLGLPSPPHVAYGNTTQLPLPVLHRSGRRRSSCSGGFSVAVLFCFFGVWMFVGYAGWLVWRLFGA